MKQKTIRGGVWMFGSNAITKLLGFVKVLILVRLLAPEDFGLIGIAIFTLLAISVFSETGVVAALVQQKNDIGDTLNTAWTIYLIRGAIIATIMFFSAGAVATFFGHPLVEPILKVMALSLFISGFRNIGTIYYIKELDLKWRAYLDQCSELVGIIITVAFALALRSVWALVIGYLLQEVFKVWLSFRIHPYRPSLQFDWKIAKDLFHYGKHILSATIIFFLIRQGDNALVGRVLGMKALGFYTLAFSLSNIPALLFSEGNPQVIFPAFSKLQYDLPRLRRAYLDVLKLIALVTVPSAVGVFILAPDIVKVMYGPQYLPMIPVVRILCLFGLLRSILFTQSELLKAYGRPQLFERALLIQLIVMVVLIYPFSIWLHISGTSLATTTAIFVGVCWASVSSNKMINLRLIEVISSISPYFLYSSVMALSVFLLRLSLARVGFLQLLILIALGGFVYAGQLLILEREMIDRYLVRVFRLSGKPTV